MNALNKKVSNKNTVLRIAIAQINLMVGDIEGNAKRILQWSQRACDEMQADVIVFPELALTGYPPDDLLLRPGMYERVNSALESLRLNIKGITALIGYPEKTQEGVYNAVAVLDNGNCIFTARKQHLPNYRVFDEKRYFVSGYDSNVFTLNNVSVGICICEDIWYPQPIKKAVASGAQIILSIHASPFHENKRLEREQIIQSRVKETKIPILYANLVGGQDELVFDGQSFVIDAEGVLTHRFPAFTETLACVDFESSSLKPLNPTVTPTLTEEASVYQALVTGVRDYVSKSGFTRVVIGLSGGIDSALTLSIAVDALGADKVEAVMMPSRYTQDMSVEDAKEQAEIWVLIFKSFR